MLALAGVLVVPRAAMAQLTQAEPAVPIVVPFPAGEPARETQVTVQVVVAPTGDVESAVEISRVPGDASDALVRAAIDAVKATRFVPSSRDGSPIRSRDRKSTRLNSS